MKKLTMNEQIFLIAIWRLKDEAFGVKIREQITQMTGSKMLFGTLYNSLDYMAQKGLVLSRREKTPNEKGGNDRVYYEITAKGMEALKRARQLQTSIWKGFPEYAFEPEED
ncbi:PadR family transcriptional regulator [Acidobacteriota bacterium]